MSRLDTRSDPLTGLFLAFEEKLSQVARQKIQEGQDPTTFAVFCLDTASEWMPLAEKLVPRARWPKPSSEGARPVLRGWLKMDFFDKLSDELPKGLKEDVQDRLARSSRTSVLALAFGEGGCVGFEVTLTDS